MVGVPRFDGDRRQRSAKVSAVPLQRSVAAWSLRVRGGPNGFGGANLMVGVPVSMVIDDRIGEGFGVATTASCCSVVGADQGGAVTVRVVDE